MKRTSKLLAAVSSITLVALGASPAMAAGTKVGETISNEVFVDFTVGNVAQTQQTATDNLAIDRKVNLTVAQVGSTTTNVSPGQTGAVTTFTVTNLTNDVVDFALSAASLNGAVAPNGGANSSFDVTNVRIFRDNLAGGTVGVYDPTDTLVTFLGSIAADGDAGNAVTVFVLSDIPLGETTNETAVVSLTARARVAGTSGATAFTINSGANNAAGVDTVLADLAGSDDAVGDATFSARDDYTVRAAAISATKTSRIISDPINGTSANAKAIPGAVIEYCIAVTNAAGGVTAENLTLSDPLPSETTLVGNSVRINGTVTGTGACNLDGTAGATTTGTTVTETLANLPAGNTRTLVFRATIL